MERKVCVKTDADPPAEPAGGWHRKEEAMEAYEVFTQKYTEVYRDLYRFACYMLRNPQDAEDVVGETVADAYAGFSNLRSIDAFRSWIFQILSNKMPQTSEGICTEDCGASGRTACSPGGDGGTDGCPEGVFSIGRTGEAADWPSCIWRV